MSAGDPLLEVLSLSVTLPVSREARQVISNVSFSLAKGESIGLVGESGSGKSITVRAVLRSLANGAAVDGTINFDGESVYQMPKARVRQWHRDDVALIHQDPRAYINPLRTIGDFLTEGLRLTRGVTRKEADRRAIGMLEDVGIEDADRRMKQYPHQLSGGLLQRVMIASALLSEPKLLIADEPTTALDVTTQEEVMAILDELRRERELAMIIITHDLDLAAAVTDRLAVMYAGVIVESGSASSMQAEAKHPYTAGLLASRPSIERREELWVIPGRPIAAWEVGTGCTFAMRCPFAQQRCREFAPALRPVGSHQVACHRAEELEGHLTAEGMSAK